MSPRDQRGITYKERDFLLKHFEISHLDWHSSIYAHGTMFIEIKHPKNLYVLKTERFWNWYNCIVAGIEDELIQRLRYEKSTEEMRGVKFEYEENYIYHFFYDKGVKHLKLSRFEMSLINNEYKKKFGKIPRYYKPVEKSI